MSVPAPPSIVSAVVHVPVLYQMVSFPAPMLIESAPVLISVTESLPALPVIVVAAVAAIVAVMPVVPVKADASKFVTVELIAPTVKALAPVAMSLVVAAAVKVASELATEPVEANVRVSTPATVKAAAEPVTFRKEIVAASEVPVTSLKVTVCVAAVEVS